MFSHNRGRRARTLSSDTNRTHSAIDPIGGHDCIHKYDIRGRCGNERAMTQRVGDLSRINRTGWTGVSAAALILTLILGCQSDSHLPDLPYYNDAVFTPYWYADADAVPKGFHRIGEFTLVNQDGRQIKDTDLEGKLYVANFFFATCPGICPMTMAHMKHLQDTFASDGDVLLISHSVTPDKDSVDALRAYAHRMEVVSSQWHLVTGERSHIYDLGRNRYFVEEDLGETPETRLGVSADTSVFLHTESFVLVDRNSYIRGVYNGLNRTSVNQLIADVRNLQGKLPG